MEPEAVLNPAVKKLASVNDFCANLTIPVEPAPPSFSIVFGRKMKVLASTFISLYFVSRSV